MGAVAKTDIELVEASLRGEHDAFGHLVARYQDVVCAVSYSSTGDQVLSEDVAQETFIAAWRQLDRLRNSQRLRPWLCGIARNLARTARKRRRREELVDADDQVAPGASPFDAAARGDVERVVREALARIPDAYREVLVLYYREDHSIREVADALGLTETTVMQRLSRGRRYLADSVSELVERSLRTDRRQRDLVAAVLASIAVLPIPSRVDASPPKGSTMFKFAIAATAVVATGTTAYLVHSHRSTEPSRASTAAPAPASAVAKTTTPTLHFGSSRLGLAHPPSLGPTAAPRAIHSRSVAEADLALLPADADAVIGLNFAQVSHSALWKQYIAPQLAGVDGIRQFEALCGFDPLASLGSVSIGLKGLGQDDNTTGVVVVHGFEKAKAMSCFDQKGVPEAEKDGSKVTIDGDVVLITDATTHEHGAFTFINNTTALI
ncbi:MAG TPA: RNA polymerase sigma factor, partial [Kofleriaceae bacterium]|nr:RNA polymerase sigma factor [Kofleriaceae bacterium]